MGWVIAATTYGKELRYSLYRRFGVWTDTEKRKSLAPTELGTPDRPSVAGAIPTSLSCYEKFFGTREQFATTRPKECLDKPTKTPQPIFSIQDQFLISFCAVLEVRLRFITRFVRFQPEYSFSNFHLPAISTVNNASSCYDFVF